ncbi:MAG: hypothetical protein JSV01_00860 [Desulfobacterales bacterium]|nr:MAG: hypothetical protein JSV01_00860 [Desulfobacterales bacterium]UCG80133.1 MAG: hypothetical protein JSV60_09210 [Desulfobacterales bacterium]
MTTIKSEMPIRLEEVISWAREGKKIKASVKLSREPIVEVVLVEAGYPQPTPAYLLNAEYTFEVDGKSYKVAKTYLRGSGSESVKVSAANRNVTNARLKMDYDRLRQAGIDLKEKYFEKLKL